MSDRARASPTEPEQIPGDCNPDEAVSRAAIYARTSASKPDYHYSIDEQVSRCWDRCKEHDWDVVFVFTDKAESGRDTDRPEFQDMLGKAEQGYFDVVVFWKLDRFCRSLTDLVRTEERLDEHGVALQSVTEYIDTASPVGRFNFRNLASAAELESDLTSQRVQIGMHGMAKEHRWPNSDPPIGYQLADDQTLGIDEEAARLVRRIFRMYLKHRSMPKVAHLLNKDGKRTKEDNEWTRWTVGRVLKNEVYRGEYQLGDYQTHVEEYRIVSDELFEAVKEIRFRFKHEKGSMEQDRKAKTATKILDRFKSAKEVDK